MSWAKTRVQAEDGVERLEQVLAQGYELSIGWQWQSRFLDGLRYLVVVSFSGCPVLALRLGGGFL